jgi:hypothetical protein
MKGAAGDGRALFLFFLIHAVVIPDGHRPIRGRRKVPSNTFLRSRLYAALRPG